MTSAGGESGRTDKINYEVRCSDHLGIQSGLFAVQSSIDHEKDGNFACRLKRTRFTYCTYYFNSIIILIENPDDFGRHVKSSSVFMIKTVLESEKSEEVNHTKKRPWLHNRDHPKFNLEDSPVSKFGPKIA